MKIVYVGHGRFPTEKAHGHQIAQVCAAMARLGHEVTLLTPTVKNSIHVGPHAYYGLSEAFAVERLENFDALNSRLVPEPLALHVSMRSYGRRLVHRLTGSGVDPLHEPSPPLLPALLSTGIPVAIELHALPRYGRRAFVRRCNQCALVVCLTSLMRLELERWGVDPSRMVVEGDGVDLRPFAQLPSAEEAKEQAEVPASRTIIGYVGSLPTGDGKDKGVDELLHAVELLNRREQHRGFLWIVGGPEKARRAYQELAGHMEMQGDVRFEGAVPASAVPGCIAACDVCVYPAPASDDPYFRRDTSPLKLFEYLAAGKPVVCAALPPVLDVVDGSTVRLCPPGDPQALMEAIDDVLSNPKDAAERAARGKEAVRTHSWDERMKRVLDHLDASAVSPRGGDSAS